MPRPKKGATRDGLTYLGLEDGKFKYEARITVRHKGKVRERQRTILGVDRRDIEAKHKELAEQFRAELAAEGLGRGATVEVLIRKWLETLRHSTRITYSSYARHFERAFGDRSLASLGTPELQRFLDDLPLSDHSTNCVRGALCAFFEWAKGEHIHVNAMAETRRRKKRMTDEELLESVQAPPVRRSMSSEEIRLFLRVFERTDPEVYLIIATQLLLGCRIGEAIALHWSDIDEHGVVVVRHNFSKGRLSVPKNKQARIAALGPQWLARLREHRERLLAEGRPKADELVFPVPITHVERRKCGHHFWHYRKIWERFAATLQACGITLAKRTATHAMRYTLISRVREEQEHVAAARFLGITAGTSARDEELRRRVGHGSAAMSEHYTEVSRGRLIDLSEAFERRVMGEPIASESSTKTKKCP